MKNHSCLNVHYKILHYLGFWPPDPEESSRLSRTWRFVCPRFFIVRFAYAPIFHVFGARCRWGDPISRTEELILVMMWSFMFVKFTGLFLKRERLAGLFADLDCCGEDDDDETCEEMRRSCTQNTDWSAKFLIVSAFVAAVSLSLPMYWQAFQKRSIPLRWWMPVDITPSPVFEVVAVFTITAGMVDVMSLSICDTLLITIILQTANRLKVLRYKIANSREMVKLAMSKEAAVKSPTGRAEKGRTVVDRLRVAQNCAVVLVRIQDGGASRQLVLLPVDEKTRREEAFDRRAEAFLGRRVQTHVAMIASTREIQQTFNHALKCQMVLNVSVAVMALYVTTVSDGFSSEVMICIVLCLFTAYGFYLQCAAGHSLTEQSAGVRESAYACAWPHASERFKRMLRIVMCRADRPLLLRAAGLPLNFNTFRMATRASYYMHKILDNMFHGKKINNRP